MAPDSSPSPESRSESHAESNEKSFAIASRNFLLGFGLSGVPILAYLWLSVDMTYGSWAAVGTVRLVGAIAVPLVFGILSARWGRRFVQQLCNALETVNLPF